MKEKGSELFINSYLPQSLPRHLRAMEAAARDTWLLPATQLLAFVTPRHAVLHLKAEADSHLNAYLIPTGNTVSKGQVQLRTSNEEGSLAL